MELPSGFTPKSVFLIIFFVLLIMALIIWGILSMTAPPEPEPVIDIPVEIIIKNDTAVTDELIVMPDDRFADVPGKFCKDYPNHPTCE